MKYLVPGFNQFAGQQTHKILLLMLLISISFFAAAQQKAIQLYNGKARPPGFCCTHLLCDLDIKNRIVKADAPPLFIAAATDEPLAPVSNSVDLYYRLDESKKTCRITFVCQRWSWPS